MDVQFETSPETELICAALVAVQGKLANPERNRRVAVDGTPGRPGYEFAYATLDRILLLLRTANAKQGLALVQMPTVANSRRVLLTRLVHRSGQWMQSVFPLPNTDDVNAFASALTVVRRNVLCALYGIHAAEDDDGATAMGVSQTIVDGEATAPPTDEVVQAGRRAYVALARVLKGDPFDAPAALRAWTEHAETLRKMGYEETTAGVAIDLTDRIEQALKGQDFVAASVWRGALDAGDRASIMVYALRWHIHAERDQAVSAELAEAMRAFLDQQAHRLGATLPTFTDAPPSEAEDAPAPEPPLEEDESPPQEMFVLRDEHGDPIESYASLVAWEDAFMRLIEQLARSGHLTEELRLRIEEQNSRYLAKEPAAAPPEATEGAPPEPLEDDPGMRWRRRPTPPEDEIQTATPPAPPPFLPVPIELPRSATGVVNLRDLDRLLAETLQACPTESALDDWAEAQAIYGSQPNTVRVRFTRAIAVRRAALQAPHDG